MNEDAIRFMKQNKITFKALGSLFGVSPYCVHAIINGKRKQKTKIFMDVKKFFSEKGIDLGTEHEEKSTKWSGLECNVRLLDQVLRNISWSRP